MPDGASTRTLDGKAGGKMVMKYGGKDIALDIPPMEVKTPRDKKKLEAIITEQLKKDPKYAEVNKLKFEQWKEQNVTPALAQIDALEKQTLKQIAESELPEEKEAGFDKGTQRNHASQ